MSQPSCETASHTDGEDVQNVEMSETGASGDLDSQKNRSGTDHGEDNSPVEFKVPSIVPKPPKTTPQNDVAKPPKCQPGNVGNKPGKLHSKLSPAELLKHSETPLPYKEPVWSGLCSGNYKFEVIKNGTVIASHDLTKKTFYVVGRLPICDLPMEHPSLSRYHAIVQYCKQKNEKHDIGWYLYDLGSTHGTWLNKQKIQPRIYYRLKVGHVIKFGGSTRLHILQGPDVDQEAESELTLTEMKEQREQKKKEIEVLKLAEAVINDETSQENVEKEDACSWGFGEDAREEETINPFASLEPENEALYVDDPKKSLKGFFEREGFDLPDYQVTELGRGKYQCTVELPVDSASGEPLVAEATVTGKKKEAVVACALEACRILDKMGELRKANHESRKKKAKNWEENDFYDSDDDTFLDRTGDIERKRKQRMQRLGKDKPQVQNYDSIMSDLEKVEAEMSEIQEKLDKAKAEAAAIEAEEGLDALDAFMANIKSGAMDSKTRMALKRRHFDLKQQQVKLQKLANVAKPADFKLRKPQEEKTTSAKGAHSVFGKIKVAPLRTTSKVNPSKQPIAGPDNAEFEVEEDEEEMETDETKEKQQCKVDQIATSENVEKTNATSSNSEKRKSSENEETVLNTKRQKNEVNETLSTTVEAVEEREDTVSTVVPESGDMTGVDVLRSGDTKSTCSPKSGDRESADEHKTDGTLDTSIPSRSNSNTQPKGQMTPTLEFVQKKTKSEKKPVKKKKVEPTYKELSAADPDYQTWLPPENQSGDGKTSLNEKYGY